MKIEIVKSKGKYWVRKNEEGYPYWFRAFDTLIEAEQFFEVVVAEQKEPKDEVIKSIEI